MSAPASWFHRRISDARNLMRASGALSVPLPVAATRFLKLKYGSGYSHREIFNLGMLADAPLIAPGAHYSKSRLRAMQLRVNPRAYFPYTENKLVFFHRCREHGLLTPEVHAVVSLRPPHPAGPFAQTPEELPAVLGEGPLDLALKPAGGVYGRGLRLLRFEAGGFTGFDGTRHSAAGLFDHMRQWKYATWLFQARVFPHPDLARISGTQAMQCIRAISFCGADGRVRIPVASFKIINGSSEFDNFDLGLTSNMRADVDPSNGRLGGVYERRSDGGGLRQCSHHPRTGQRIEGGTLPFWPEAVDLVERAARAFLPLKTIGWDVAITPDGPTLLEGNVTWDPPVTREPLRELDPLFRAAGL